MGINSCCDTLQHQKSSSGVSVSLLLPALTSVILSPSDLVHVTDRESVPVSPASPNLLLTAPACFCFSVERDMVNMFSVFMFVFLPEPKPVSLSD